MKLNYTKTRLRSVQHKRNSKTRSRGMMPSACIGPQCSQQGLSVAKADILPIRFPASLVNRIFFTQLFEGKQ